MAKLALVTGASAGIGREACALFARNGYKVIALSRQPSGVESAMNTAHESFWFDEQGSKSLESVSLVLPGPVATRFREHALAAMQPVTSRASAVHKEKYEAMEAALAPGAKLKPFTASASDVAKKIYRAAEAARPKPRYLVTPQTYAGALITRFMPHSVQRLLLK
ncbi:MAG: SDR family NAD(P)-dependent oxidoreductase [Marinobacter sp.]